MTADELVVGGLDAGQQLALVPGGELEPAEVVGLVELAEGGVERGRVRVGEGGRAAVELDVGVVLQLAVDGDLALEGAEPLGPVVGLAQGVHADGARRRRAAPRPRRRPTTSLRWMGTGRAPRAHEDAAGPPVRLPDADG